MHVATAQKHLANLSDDETRCELSDWAVNTLREEFGHAVAHAVCVEEFARIHRAGITTLIGYLRTRRPGSTHRLNRAQRVAVYCNYATQAARPTRRARIFATHAWS